MLGALTIQRLLLKMKEVGASDLHIKIGSPPVLRIASVLQRVDAPDLEANDTRQLLLPIIPAHLADRVDADGGVDFSHHEGSNERFRCSVFRSGGGFHAAIRRVNPEIPSFKDLHLPPVYEQLSHHTHEGLIVICGVTGSGKSSTLAAMIEYINNNEACNIITIEDPVEYLFRPKRSFISQREIGIDVPDFPRALRAGVRQDPDILMIGELRDRETMLAGIQAAETGHVVFCTLHTADTMQSFARILEFFPSHEHNFIRSSLAAGLQAVCAQRLLPSVRPGVARVPATEVLLNNSTVADKIREGEDEDLPAIMAGSAHEGMHSFTDSLARLVEEEYVDLKTAERYAPNAEALRSRVRGIQVKADVLVSRKR
ncbi:MAG TPA: PilT/PilU family type 4a pilus ATPase [Phycisphaerales bacterium]|nr:PilT/PilU family type 4a pilus ATPase [Phycisphaerales bacterium]HRQ75680.1 PilT/PilU family type 4a pilus ATPase [Phycisphaerales bacterium]